MPDPRNMTPRTRQVQRHTTATPVPPGVAGPVHRAAAALVRQDALARTPNLPLDPNNSNPPMPDPPTGDHNVKTLSADDTKPAEGTGQPDEDDDKEERGRLRRADDDADDANSNKSDGAPPKDPDPDDEKPPPKS